MSLKFEPSSEPQPEIVDGPLPSSITKDDLDVTLYVFPGSIPCKKIQSRPKPDTADRNPEPNTETLNPTQCRHSTLNTQHQHSTLNTQHSTLNTQHS